MEDLLTYLFQHSSPPPQQRQSFVSQTIAGKHGTPCLLVVYKREHMSMPMCTMARSLKTFSLNRFNVHLRRTPLINNGSVDQSITSCSCPSQFFETFQIFKEMHCVHICSQPTLHLFQSGIRAPSASQDTLIFGR